MHPVIRIRLAAIGITLCLGGAAARADVVAVVSSRSAITTLSKIQAVDIFLGKVSRFPNGAQAVPIDQIEGSRARDEFYVKVSGKSAAQLTAYWSKMIFTGRGEPPTAVPNSIEVKKRVAENAAAIGYIEAALVDDSVRVVTLTGQ